MVVLPGRDPDLAADAATLGWPGSAGERRSGASLHWVAVDPIGDELVSRIRV